MRACGSPVKKTEVESIIGILCHTCHTRDSCETGLPAKQTKAGTLISQIMLEDQKREAQLPMNYPTEDKPSKADSSLSTTFWLKSHFRPTVVFDTYWRFAVERQSIFFKKVHGELAPWTEDLILQRHKFTNAYRASDRVSQYLIRNVIYGGDSSPEEVFFRILLFKIFNKTETWERLTQEIGPISYATYAFDTYDTALSRLSASGHSIFSAAYIMPSGSQAFRSPKKHRSWLHLLERMMEDEVPFRLMSFSSMSHAFDLLRSYPMIGDFLGYQLVTDLNYSSLTSFSEMEFVIPGPGARDGIHKCFSDLGGWSETDVIRAVAERQREEFEQRNLDFQSLWGRPLQLIDCQNLFCEVDKYSRLAHPEIRGSSGRTQIKQLYRMHSTPILYWYPPKWELNDLITSIDVNNTSTPRDGGK